MLERMTSRQKTVLIGSGVFFFILCILGITIASISATETQKTYKIGPLNPNKTLPKIQR